jgi:hypothetical protein
MRRVAKDSQLQAREYVDHKCTRAKDERVGDIWAHLCETFHKAVPNEESLSLIREITKSGLLDYFALNRHYIEKRLPVE